MSGQSNHAAEVFLEVVTRTFGGRPTLLSANRESLWAQTDTDWVQTLLFDHERRGVIYANKRLRTFAPVGKYVWLLDDDDLCIRPSLVAELKEIAQLNAPDVIIIRMDHGPQLGILPGGLQWGNRQLQHGHIGCSGFVVSRETWNRFRHCYGESYHGDFEFIAAVTADRSVRVYWHDVIASKVQLISRGQAERENGVRYRAKQNLTALVNGRLVSLTAGQVYELVPADADDLVRAGYVTAVVPAPAAPEAAAIAPSERAVVSSAAPKTLPKARAKRSK